MLRINDVDHIQSVEQGLVEAAREHLVVKIATRRGDYAHVSFSIGVCRTEPASLFCGLEKREKCLLQNSIERANLIDEQSAAIRVRQRFQQAALRCRAVRYDEWAVATRAVHVDATGNFFFSDVGAAGDQDPGVRPSRVTDFFEDFALRDRTLIGLSRLDSDHISLPSLPKS